MKKWKKRIALLAVSSLLTMSACNGLNLNLGQESQTQPSSVPSAVESMAESDDREERNQWEAQIDAYNTKYFVQKLSDSQLKCFSRVYNAVKNFESDVDFDYPIHADTLDTLIYLINYDCPELIQLDGEYIPKYVDEAHTSVSGVRLSFVMDAAQHDKAMKKLDTVLQRIKKSVRGKSQYEQEKYVYDYLFKRTVYTETTKNSGSMYGALVEHKARCEGLCKSIMWLMRNMDIECLSVRGTPKWENSSIYGSHSWNMIQIDNAWYYLDITVDNLRTDENGEATEPNYGFFNVDDSFIEKTHEVDSVYTDLGVPKCNHTQANYHIKNKLCIAKTDDVQSAVNQILEQHFKNHQVKDLSIRFEDEADYQTAKSKMKSYLREFVIDRGDMAYQYSFYSVDLSKSFVLNITPSEPSESSS